MITVIEKKKIVTFIFNNLEYISKLHVCPEPLCSCSEISFIFMLNEQVNEGNKESIEFGYDLKTKTLVNIKKLSPEKQLFAKTFFSEISENILIQLSGFFFNYKICQTENAPLSKLNAKFDWLEIEKNSRLTEYNRTLIFGEILTLSIDGTDYFIRDSYCLNTQCGCSNAFFYIYIPSNTIPVVNNNLAFDFIKKKWMTKTDNDNLEDYSIYIEQIEKKYGAEKFVYRFNKLKNLYHNFLKKNKKFNKLYPGFVYNKTV